MAVTLSETSRKILVCLVLSIVTLAVFWQVKNYDFVNLDDKMYILENRNVLSGLTIDGVKWAFTSVYASNWHPMTWLSHMLDVDLFGVSAGRFHLVNVFFHIAASLLLFLILDRMTGALWRSAFVGALFALHPLHVESVAWIAERKDVLSAFFWMLTLGAYVLYTEKKQPGRYLAALLFFRTGAFGQAHARDASVCPAAARYLAAEPPAGLGILTQSRCCACREIDEEGEKQEEKEGEGI
jgi:hypothetical protein